MKRGKLKTWMKRGLFALGTLVLLGIFAAGWLLYRLGARTEGHYFDSAGVKIHYTDEGKGFPIILVHGIGANADINWRAAGTVARLSREFRVITFDLRGHGLSGRPADPKDYGAELVQDIPRLMDHLGIEKAHIAGYSLGGFLTLKLLTLHPERVATAAFCASGWADVDDVKDVLSPYRAPSEESVELIRRLARSTPPYVWGSVADLLDPFLDRVTLDKKSKRAIKKSYGELRVSQEQLAAITTPCICFMGTADGLAQYACDLKQHMKDLEFVVLEGEGHITTAMSAKFKTRLQSFFAEHTPADAAMAAVDEATR